MILLTNYIKKYIKTIKGGDFMGLLRDNNIREEDIERIRVEVERPDSILGVIRIESISIDGKNIDRYAVARISNKLVNNTEFLEDSEVKEYVSNKLGINPDFIDILG